LPFEESPLKRILALYSNRMPRAIESGPGTFERIAAAEAIIISGAEKGSAYPEFDDSDTSPLANDSA
jgi:hypothetical protein